VLSAYKTEGYVFVNRALEDPKFLEELTGLSELHKDTEAADVDWLEEDEEGED
ncbi:hypothetical protein HK405_004642, partial [Cladochytrium tenue]